MCTCPSRFKAANAPCATCAFGEAAFDGGIDSSVPVPAFDVAFGYFIPLTLTCAATLANVDSDCRRSVAELEFCTWQTCGLCIATDDAFSTETNACRNYEFFNYGPGPFLCGAPTNCATLLDMDGGCLAAVDDVMEAGAACEGVSTFLGTAAAVLTTLCGP